MRGRTIGDRWTSRLRPAIVALVLLVVLGAARPVGADAGMDPGGGRPRYHPPTDGAVLDPFRPPPEPWLAGNRGIEYDTEPGAPVVAIGPGVVTFAGPVAGRLIVVVRHPDGLRSSYVGVAVILVRRGDAVRPDQTVALAADTLHLGVRRGRAYLDPASLWGRRVGGGRVVLVADRPHSRAGPSRRTSRSRHARPGRSRRHARR